MSESVKKLISDILPPLTFMVVLGAVLLATGNGYTLFKSVVVFCCTYAAMNLFDEALKAFLRKVQISEKVSKIIIDTFWYLSIMIPIFLGAQVVEFKPWIGFLLAALIFLHFRVDKYFEDKKMQQKSEMIKAMSNMAGLLAESFQAVFDSIEVEVILTHEDISEGVRRLEGFDPDTASERERIQVAKILADLNRL